MHEMGLAEGILDVVLGLAEAHPVRTVQLRVGALQQVAPESLSFWFEMAAAETPAADAVLDQREIAPRLRCAGCGYEGGFSPPFCCPACGVAEIEITAGDELLVDAIERDNGWIRRPEGQAATSVATVPLEHLMEHAGAVREMSEGDFWARAEAG